MNAMILLVEDDENDLMFVKMAMKKAGVANPVQVAHDGQEVLDYFQGNGKFADRAAFPLPYLVLLDLKLPYVMGLDVLTWIHNQPQFKSTVVIVLTSSRHVGDIGKAYRLGANAYLVKPAGLNALEGMMRTLKDFWLIQNTPPPDWAGRQTEKFYEQRVKAGKGQPE
jgi:DNA-binding response OmpR family regulator